MKDIKLNLLLCVLTWLAGGEVDAGIPGGEGAQWGDLVHSLDLQDHNNPPAITVVLHLNPHNMRVLLFAISLELNIK